MRVISGSLRGRVLKGHNIMGTRPTMDRVKESIFASIQDYLDESIILDLFAGSGNLGIEAISNGASEAYFVDNNKECIKVINGNIRDFGILNNCITLKSDYKDAIKYFGSKNIKFNIIFVDPPYKYNIKNEILRLVINNDILYDNGIIVFEYQNEEAVDEDISFALLKNKKYGDKYVSIYQKQ